jgi:hypothetical protein
MSKTGGLHAKFEPLALFGKFISTTSLLENNILDEKQNESIESLDSEALGDFRLN